MKRINSYILKPPRLHARGGPLKRRYKPRIGCAADGDRLCLPISCHIPVGVQKLLRPWIFLPEIYRRQMFRLREGKNGLFKTPASLRTDWPPDAIFYI